MKNKKKKQFSVRMDQELIEKVDQYAARENRNRNNAIETLVADGLAANLNFGLFQEKTK